MICLGCKISHTYTKTSIGKHCTGSCFLEVMCMNIQTFRFYIDSFLIKIILLWLSLPRVSLCFLAVPVPFASYKKGARGANQLVLQCAAMWTVISQTGSIGRTAWLPQQSHWRHTLGLRDSLASSSDTVMLAASGVKILVNVKMSTFIDIAIFVKRIVIKVFRWPRAVKVLWTEGQGIYT